MAATMAATMVATRAKTARLAYVDGLRALAALYVVIGHFNQTLIPTHRSSLPLLSASLKFFGYGHLAVSVFIVLSGFSLALPVAWAGWRLPGGAWRFFGRRARRILPPYYATLALSILLGLTILSQQTGVIWDEAIPITWRSVVIHLALVQDFTRDNTTIDYVLWSIALECQIYLLFPALVALWQRYHPSFAAICVVVASLMLTLALIPTWIGQLLGYGFDGVAPQYIGLFALGMTAAWYVQQPPTQRMLWGWLTLMLCGVIASAAIFASAMTFFSFILLLDPIIGVITAGVLVVTPYVRVMRAALSWRPLAWIGGFSYSVYLVHPLILQLIWQYAIHPLRLTGSAAYLAPLGVGLIGVLLGAWVFFWLCERPFLSATSRALPHAVGLTPPGEPAPFVGEPAPQ